MLPSLSWREESSQANVEISSIESSCRHVQPSLFSPFGPTSGRPRSAVCVARMASTVDLNVARSGWDVDSVVMFVLSFRRRMIATSVIKQLSCHQEKFSYLRNFLNFANWGNRAIPHFPVPTINRLLSAVGAPSISQ